MRRCYTSSSKESPHALLVQSQPANQPCNHAFLSPGNPLAHDLDTSKRHREAPIAPGQRRAGTLTVIARPGSEAADVVVWNPPAVAAALDTRRAAPYPTNAAHVALVACVGEDVPGGNEGRREAEEAEESDVEYVA